MTISRSLKLIGFAALVASGCAVNAIEDPDIRQERSQCYHSDGDVCETVGMRFEDAIGVERNHAVAEHFYAWGCRRGNPSACGELGELYLTSPHINRSAEEGVELLDGACFRYDMDSCMVLIDALHTPEMSYTDPERGEAIRTRICDLGYDPACPAIDTDGDGIIDPDDLCPDVPEDADGFEDADGCPELDNDNDGILDADDGCPDVAEDPDGFEDEDGCPELDNDNDGINDDADACPLVAEDVDGFEDEDGCPELDNDGDGLLDANDQCVNEPEDFDGFEDEDGCPEEGAGAVQLTCTNVEIAESVQFGSDSDDILEESNDLLNQVATVLRGASYITLIRVEGHTDDRGSDEHNLELSQRRAASVMQYLITAGVDANRLASEGYGETLPIADNGSRAGRAENRRVDFVIIEQDSSCE